ncbi:MAG: hypothetical protein OET90_11885 [Desulfuromonadales bacterium]|nr:hypothetical protein [Desulfuromonadales bacterium]
MINNMYYHYGRVVNFLKDIGEGGIRGPLLIAGPGVKGGRQVNSFAYVWDLMPTLLDFAGITHPKEYKGQQIAP